LENNNMADADLIAALKQARSKKMFFVFLPKGGSDGTLLVAKTKFPSKAIADAKKQSGGGNAVTGKCFGDGKTLVFEVAKAVPATMEPALKKVIKRDTGLALEPQIQLAGDADADEQANDAANPNGAAANGAAANGGPFNLTVYQAARQKVVTGLKALAAKVAATRHKSAAGALKEINAILNRLVANPGPNDVTKLRDYIATDGAITDVEDMPNDFHDLDVRAPLLSAWK
jgi:hypothetical protein